MPIKIPGSLPARSKLVAEGVSVISNTDAYSQDIRPLQIGLLNLMPNKAETETQFARLLGASPIQVDLRLLNVASHKAKNTSQQHLIDFYTPWEDVKDCKFDGFIITGAPIEKLEYEEVTYWDELRQIMDWTVTNVHSTMFVCWGAMAGLSHFHNIAKRTLDKKAFGIYSQQNQGLTNPLVAGVSDELPMPVSRWTTIDSADIEKLEELDLLLASPETGPCLISEETGNRVYILNHVEYGSNNLAEEYARDTESGRPIELPYNYFPGDDTGASPKNTWRSHAQVLFRNWVNTVYSETPFDLAEIGSACSNVEIDLTVEDQTIIG